MSSILESVYGLRPCMSSAAALVSRDVPSFENCGGRKLITTLNPSSILPPIVSNNVTIRRARCQRAGYCRCLFCGLFDGLREPSAFHIAKKLPRKSARGINEPNGARKGKYQACCTSLRDFKMNAIPIQRARCCKSTMEWLSGVTSSVKKCLIHRDVHLLLHSSGRVVCVKTDRCSIYSYASPL